VEFYAQTSVSAMFSLRNFTLLQGH
jgi:hypothetical protein